MGQLRVGYDGDMLVFDPDRFRAIDLADLKPGTK